MRLDRGYGGHQRVGSNCLSRGGFVRSLRLSPWPDRLQCAHSSALSRRSTEGASDMHATIRRYEGVDAARTNEITGKVKESLVPQLRELPGFAGYYLIEAGDGILSSLGLFETSEQADESSKVASKWLA